MTKLKFQKNQRQSKRHKRSQSGGKIQLTTDFSTEGKCHENCIFEVFKKDQCKSGIQVQKYPSEIKMKQRLVQKLSELTAAAAKSLQSCPTLCDPIDGSPPGSPIPGILQARTLEWVNLLLADCN